MSTEKNVLIVLAAGLGKRMGRDVPKMLLSVRGKPLLFWTLKNLEGSRAVDAVVLTAPEGLVSDYLERIKRWKFKKVRVVIEGGKERQDSTRRALERLPADCEIVGIHDGARPLTPPVLLERCFDAARRQGAAILAVPCKDTVKVAARNLRIQRTVPREQCWAAQTPQVFRRDIAERIHGVGPHAKDRRLRGLFTDDASMAEALGIPVRIVPSSYENIKVTTPEDLNVMESILRSRKW